MREGEWLERAALADLQEAADEGLRQSLGLQSHWRGGALQSIGGALPASAIVVNRALGFGLEETPSEDEVAAMVEAYQAASVERYFVQCFAPEAEAGMDGWLTSRGLERARAWQKFKRGREAAPTSRSDLRAEEIGPEWGAAFGRIASAAFDLGPEAEAWLALLPGRPHWHIFMSFDGDQPAGCGALFVKDGMAWTDFGATDPNFRRRGSQSLLLSRRVAFALENDCRSIHTCTGEWVPGDPQHSYQNILKSGFKEDELRLNYAPPRA